MSHWKLTHSGQAFDLDNPEPWMVRADDIAWSLSRLPRWCGHTVGRVISVAQHSVHVARRAWDISGDRSAAAQGLLHDASESYIGDIPTPVKRKLEAMGFPQLREFEDQILRVIFERFDLKWPMAPAVKQADREMLATEAAKCMPDNPREFYSHRDVLDFEFPNWSAKEARWAFLKEGQTLGLW